MHDVTKKLFFIILLNAGLFSKNLLYSQTISLCETEPVLKIGVIADPQYCDCDDAGVRLFRKTLEKLPKTIDSLNKYRVDFVITLGDLIDRYSESYDSIWKYYDNLTMPKYNLLGNHQFSDISEPDGTTVLNSNRMPWYYYDFTYDSWRFIVLDGTELADYSRFIHPELAAEGDSVWNSVQGNINDLPWNGGISKTQQAWMREKIEDAVNKKQNVILFCHFPLFPENIDLFLWNNRDILALLEEYPNVVAYINGHYHQGTYGIKNGIHYFTQSAMLDTDENSFSIMEIYQNEIKINGYGNIADTILHFRNFVEKKIPFDLSDTLIKYTDHKTSLIATLIPDSNLNNSPDWILDTTYFQNRYFRIASDSLLLNTDEDLSVISSIKLSVGASLCDYDTTFYDFKLYFDTLIASFNYKISDTLLSVYDTFSIDIETLTVDNSKYGLKYFLFSSDTSVIRPRILTDRLDFIPVKAGESTISLTAHDEYTGKNYKQIFKIIVNNPLNHKPDINSEAIKNYIIQVDSTLKINADVLFEDADNDNLIISTESTDTFLFNAVLIGNEIEISGLNSGEGYIVVFADDNRGGRDSLILTLFINSPPLKSVDKSNFIWQFKYGCFNLFLDSLFTDADNDTLLFSLIDPPDIHLKIESERLVFCPDSPVHTQVKIKITDTHLGELYDTLFIKINADPLLFKTRNDYYFSDTNEILVINLDSVFYDPDKDPLFFTWNYSGTSEITFSFDGPFLTLKPNFLETYILGITANDAYGGTKLANLELIPGYKSKLNPLHSKTEFRFFPNPVYEDLIIFPEGNDLNNIDIVIYDVTGKEIFNRFYESWASNSDRIEITFDNQIANGVYICKIFIDNNLVTTQKIVVQR